MKCPPCSGECNQGRNCPGQPVSPSDCVSVLAMLLWPVAAVSIGAILATVGREMGWW